MCVKLNLTEGNNEINNNNNNKNSFKSIRPDILSILQKLPHKCYQFCIDVLYNHSEAAFVQGERIPPYRFH